MGGSAFSPEGLSTPRMPPHVYTSALSRVKDLLQPHFKHVGSALEAPEKTSHGDVDILVAEQVDQTESITGEFLIETLGAEKWKTTRGSSTFHLAVRWPQEFEEEEDSVAKEPSVPSKEGEADDYYEKEEVLLTKVADLGLTTPAPTNKPSSQKYIQVDVHLCPTPEYFHWHLFFQAHGDLWNILGGIIRRHGLTASSKGLSLRIAEVELHNKEQARVLMTDDPTTVLEYLSLDPEKYWRPFTSWDAMMSYAASCRFHDPARWKDRMPEDTKKDMKANDRQRASKRPAFGYWIDTYLPEHVDDEAGQDARFSRDDVVEDAKRFFGPEFAARFEARKTKMIRLINVDTLWSEIRKGLPLEGVEIGVVMKGMKREIVGQQGGEDNDEDKVSTVEEVRKAFREDRFDDVLDWAKTNWKQVGERQKARDREKSRLHLMEKIKRDTEKSEQPSHGDKAEA